MITMLKHTKYQIAAITLLMTLGAINPQQSFASSTPIGCPGSCPAGYSFNSSCSCVPDGDPLPEMSVMMLPAALGAAGLLAIRARRKAMQNKTDKDV